MDHEESKEHSTSGGGPYTSAMTLQRAVQLGEYQPDYLSRFPEWVTMSRYVQLRFIREGMRSRKPQLMTQYAVLFNVLHFSEKTAELEPKLNHILDLVKQVDADEEYYLSQYV
jgi:hypothetical protein